MTAQVGDSYFFEGRSYKVIAQSEPVKFNPKDYGIEPMGWCTACYNGYW